MGLIMAVIMSAAMGALASFLVLKNNPQAASGSSVTFMYISNILLSVVVGIVVALVIPLGKIAGFLTRKANAYPPSIKFILINSIPMSVGNSLAVGLIVSLFGVIVGRMKMPPAVQAATPLIPMWLGSWARILLPTLLVSYVLSVVLTPVLSRILGLGGKPSGKPGKPGRPIDGSPLKE